MHIKNQSITIFGYADLSNTFFNW